MGWKIGRGTEISIAGAGDYRRNSPLELIANNPDCAIRSENAA